MKEYLKKNYNDMNDIFGYPQEYKGIKLYPIKLKDAKYQTLLYELFSQPKNYIVNREIMRTTYLKFLVYVISANHNSKPETYMDLLSDLLSHITKIEREKIVWRWKETGKEGLEAISFQLMIGDIQLEELEIDSLREILLEQNASGVEFVESYNPELEEHLNYLNRGMNDIELSDEIFTLCALMKIPLSEIEEYTFFQFRRLFEKVLVLKEYDLYKPLLSSGQVELKNGELKHYFYHSKKKGRYDDVLVTEEEFQKSDVYKATIPI